ncbi:MULTISPECIES: MAPEG family protein [unclassified Mesorhizobium]|uniref:MAPEG family protein n=1 Tax=unclassified Mesorhizobium TaxID=325217 RepID=UPI001CCDD8CD|nr:MULTISPECIES: MAPEG family protein [unclassified Mesorhizobium]MBZ9743509.1 MAPEG family protein [Mesorhizobium sp. CO1-1-4]MBZ9806191.1 MAPEG family protein [Mesorhizobium sp. ES1-6]MBZ9993169.1 MAPEG family protein [Mesorhizobium sp. BH1-1-4]
MNQTTIFWPVLAHVLLIYIVYVVIGRRRYIAVKSGEAKVGQYKVRSTEPASTVTVANNLINQFELPVLFYVLCLTLHMTNGVNYTTLALMWIFVASRYFHAWFHLTSNNLLLRNRSFVLGAVVLALGWIWLALHLLAIV